MMDKRLYFRIGEQTTSSDIADMGRYAGGSAIKLWDDLLVLDVNNPGRGAIVIERAKSFGWSWLTSPPEYPGPPVGVFE